MDRNQKANPNFDNAGNIRPKVKLYTCSNCGAKFSTDTNEMPSFCPKCDNNKFYG